MFIMLLSGYKSSLYAQDYLQEVNLTNVDQYISDDGILRKAINKIEDETNKNRKEILLLKIESQINQIEKIEGLSDLQKKKIYGFKIEVAQKKMKLLPNRVTEKDAKDALEKYLGQKKTNKKADQLLFEALEKIYEKEGRFQVAEMDLLFNNRVYEFFSTKTAMMPNENPKKAEWVANLIIIAGLALCNYNKIMAGISTDNYEMLSMIEEDFKRYKFIYSLDYSRGEVKEPLDFDTFKEKILTLEKDILIKK